MKKIVFALLFLLGYSAAHADASHIVDISPTSVNLPYTASEVTFRYAVDHHSNNDLEYILRDVSDLISDAGKCYVDVTGEAEPYPSILGTFVVSFPENKSMVQLNYEVNLGQQSIWIRQLPPPELAVYTVSGEGVNQVTIGLSDSQIGVTYTLLCDGIRQTSLTGNGLPLRFASVSRPGTYTVEASYSGKASKIMSGSVTIAGTDTANWIKTKTFLDAAGTSFLTDVAYYDGLGRPVQRIAVGASPVSGRDVVEYVEYDCMGRSDSVSYLPFPAPAGNVGKRLPDPRTVQTAYYGQKFAGSEDRHYAYSKNTYDGAGLLATSSGPGESSAAHPVRYTYRKNVAADGVKKYVVEGNRLKYAGPYPENLLKVKISEQAGLPSDQQSESYEYADATGRIVVREIRAGDDRRFTYYVYDDLGRQRFVVPPVLDDLIGSVAYPDQALISKYGYYMEYDGYGHVITQCVPGAEPVYNLYDRRGRLAMTQDGQLRDVDLWAFTKYDLYDRPVMSGVYHGGTLEYHRGALQDQTVFGESRGTALHGYTDVTYPVVEDPRNVHVINYYDDYGWQSGNAHAFSEADALDGDLREEVVGLQTGTKVKVLGIAGDQWLTTVTYYDREYRPLQSVSDLFPAGKEIVSNAHDFSGKVIQTRVRQDVGGETCLYDKWFDFDTQGRLLRVRQRIDGDANGEVTVASYTYDELGNVKTKGIHGDADVTAYEYDIAGNGIGEESSRFSYKLWLDKSPAAGWEGRHDGNLACVTWGNDASGNRKGYRFSYDRFGQMTSARFLEHSGSAWTETEKYAEKNIAYDRNGNITALQRTDGTGNLLHDLAFGYTHAANGNALTSVTWNGTPSAAFLYDPNGNMLEDGRTGVQVAYNLLNLPERIFANDGEIRYIYSAAGEKLGMASEGSLTYYRSVMVYGQQGEGPERLLYVLHPEGLVSKTTGGYVYRYFKRDYQGNVRLLLSGDGQELVEDQRTDYYPYGLAHAYENLHLNPYLYSGKEYQPAMVGGGALGLYDFGSRYYNPLYGRWFNIDPALQLANPYVYCGNNPVMFVDPNGEFVWFVPIMIGAAIGVGSYTMSVALSPGGFDNWSWGGFFAGMGAGALGGVASAAVSAALPALGGFAGGALSGTAGGFVGGALHSWFNGAGFGKGLWAGIKGGMIGGAAGGLIRGFSARSGGFNFWNGSKVIGEQLSASSASGQTYGAATLKGMANQAKADVESLWGIKTGRNGLVDISTMLDAGARGKQYTYQNGFFVNGAGENVDGFTLGYDNGNSKIFLSPDAAASRVGVLSDYSVTTITKGMPSVTWLSPRYVSVLGHELIHVSNWFNGGFRMPLNDYIRYSENAAYTFSKQVYRHMPWMVRAISNMLDIRGWNVSYPGFSTTPIFR